MPRFRLFEFRPLAGTIVELSDWLSLNFSRGIGNVEQGGRLVVPYWYSRAVDIEPGISAIGVSEGGLMRWSGFVTTRELTPESGTVTYGIKSWWWYYRRRWIRSRLGMSNAETTNVGPEDIIFDDVDMFDIVEDLIDHSVAVAGAADLGLTVRKHGPGAGGNSGVTRSRDYYGYERKRIDQAIDELAAQYGGFDYQVASEWDGAGFVNRYLDLHYPRIGQADSPLILRHGANVSMLRLIDDAERMANPIVVAGAGTGDAAITSGDVIDSSLLYPAGPYPYLEDDRRYGDEGTEYTGNLYRLGQSELAITRQPLRTATVDIDEQESGVRYGSIGMGDSIRLSASVGPFAEFERLRFVAETTEVSASEVLRWSMDLATDDATLGAL